MITLEMDASLFLHCNAETGLVESFTIQPSVSEISVIEKEGATEEQVIEALRCAAYEMWPALDGLPSTVIWEGGAPWE